MKRFVGLSGKNLNSTGLLNKTIDVGDHRLRIDEHLGDGGYAVIYRAKDVKTGTYYALKHIVMRSPEAKTALREEAKAMKKVQGHPHIITLFCVAFGPEKDDEQDAFMLMDLCSESLYSYMQKRKFSIPDAEVLEIFKSVCSAVQHLHSQRHPILHRDIKIENVLKHLNGNWVLCDFGSAKQKNKIKIHAQNAQMEQQEMNKMTTPAYRAPEMWDLMMGHAIDERADMWALGCMLYLLCYGSLPFTGESQLEVMAGKSVFPQTRNAAFVQLIAALLNVEPSQRPTIQHVLARVEEMQQGVQNSGRGSPSVKSPAAKPESRSVSATLITPPIEVKPAAAVPTPDQRASLMTHGSLPNSAVLNAAVQGMSKTARSGDAKMARHSVDIASIPPPRARSPAEGTSLAVHTSLSARSLPVQSEEPRAVHPAEGQRSESETRRPMTPVMPKKAVTPGQDRTQDNTAVIAEELKSLKLTVSNLNEQNQLLWSRVMALESMAKSQQKVIAELQQSHAKQAMPVSRTEAAETVYASQSYTHARAPSPMPGRAEMTAPTMQLPQKQLFVTTPSLTRAETAPPHEPPPAEHEAVKTPRNGSSRFAGTFWKNIAEIPHPPEVVESEADDHSVGSSDEIMAHDGEVVRHLCRKGGAAWPTTVSYRSPRPGQSLARREVVWTGLTTWIGWIGREARAEEASFCGVSGGYVCTEVATDPSVVRVTTEDYSFYVPKDYRRRTDDVVSEVLVAQKLESIDGTESLSIVRRLASSIKPTFFQVSDISNYGDVGAVGQLLIPKGSNQVLETDVRTLRQSPIDTGTPRGVVTLPDITIYSYRIRTREDFDVWISAGATRGNVFLLATSAPHERLAERATVFQEIHDSFQLYRKVDVERQMRKALLVLIDGLGDVSLEVLDDRTPLQAAYTPYLDAVAASGLNGLMDPVRPGVACGSDTAHLSILGYDPATYYRGRGAFEALGSGLDMDDGDVGFKCNFAFVDGATGIVEKRRADRHFESVGPVLCEALHGLHLEAFPGLEMRVRYATEHRCGIVLHGEGLTDQISGTDPLKDNLPLCSASPLDPSPEASYTARAVNAFSEAVQRILEEHPINAQRQRNGLTPANVVLFRGAGQKMKAPSFLQRTGLRGCVLAPTKIIAGLGMSIGLTRIPADRTTGSYDTLLSAKAEAMCRALSSGDYDFALLHVKAVDDAGHDQNVHAKVKLLEQIDCMISHIIKRLWIAQTDEDLSPLLVVTSDHSTPVLYGDHSSEPVPFTMAHLDKTVEVIGQQELEKIDETEAIYANETFSDPLFCYNAHQVSLNRQQCVHGDSVQLFDEVSSAHGALGRFSGDRVLPLIQDLQQRQ